MKSSRMRSFREEVSQENTRMKKLLNMSVNEIELSVRAANCLNSRRPEPLSLPGSTDSHRELNIRVRRVSWRRIAAISRTCPGPGHGSLYRGARFR